MNQYTKETITAWAILLGAVLVGVAIGYIIGNDPSLDELEEQMDGLQLQADATQAECIAELEATHRLLQREANINISPNTNGV